MVAATNWFLASKADWYLMRGTGVVSLLLFTAVVVLGIATVKRWRPGRLPRFVTPSLHRSISLLAVLFLAVHVVTAVVDPYALVNVTAVFVPFVAAKSAFWVGLGALSLDLLVVLIVSSLLRRHLGPRLWRAVHWVAWRSGFGFDPRASTSSRRRSRSRQSLIAERAPRIARRAVSGCRHDRHG